jgi:hypothetical protein
LALFQNSKAHFRLFAIRVHKHQRIAGAVLSQFLVLKQIEGRFRNVFEERGIHGEKR